MVLPSVMHALRFSAKARRLGPLGALVLASCSSLLGIEDPVPRSPCQGDACDGGGGGVPSSGGKSPVTTAGSENQPSEGGVGGEPTTPVVEAGAGGAPTNTMPVVGGEGGAGGTPFVAECDEEAVRCNIYQPQVCKSGLWMDNGDECPLACVDGGCQEPPTCSAAAAVAPCAEGASCCETTFIAGGTYRMADGDEEDPETSYERTVSDFYLDRFEVTVGRFQYFQSHYVLPEEGEGAHPNVPGSGWQKAWEELPHPFEDGRMAVPVDGDDLAKQVIDDCGGADTRTADEPRRPINCINWYVAFAFCAYDGGRLPTEAEWNYAAAFGAGQRPYPWSESMTDLSIDSTRATFYDYPTPPLLLPTAVGSHPAGRGGFFRYSDRGHDDLGGNLFEWVLDGWLDTPPADCAQDCLGGWTGGDERVVRGGGFESDYSFLRAGSRSSLAAAAIEPIRGFRCARDVNTGSE